MYKNLVIVSIFIVLMVSFSTSCSCRQTLPDGHKYTGEYNENGMLHGKGEYVFSNGYRYIGDFKNGYKHGSGIIYDKDSFKIFEGEFISGDAVKGVYYIFEGEITIVDAVKEVNSRKESRYEGSFNNGIVNNLSEYKNKYIITGNGEMHWSDGKKYTGDMKEGRMHGVGVLVHPDGKKYSGEFQYGRMVGIITSYDANGKIIEKGLFLYGKPVYDLLGSRSSITVSIVSIEGSTAAYRARITNNSNRDISLNSILDSIIFILNWGMQIEGRLIFYYSEMFSGNYPTTVFAKSHAFFNIYAERPFNLSCLFPANLHFRK